MLFAAALLPLILSPTPQQLSNLRLHDGFTLTYQVTVHDVRTPVLREKDMTEQQAGVAREEAAGRIAPSMRSYFEKQALELGQPRPVEHFTITLSARDGKLLYLSTRGARNQKDGTESAIVLDGDREYQADDSTGAMINNDGWWNAPVYAGENVDRLAFCPLPGMSLPNVDMIQSPTLRGKTSGGHFLFAGLVPRLNVITGGASPYKEGAAEAELFQGRLRIKALTVGPSSGPQQLWQITAFRLFQDHWLGTKMRWTEYEASLADTGERLASDLPMATADYALIEARPTALAVSAFEIGTYLRDKASVADDSTGRTIFFAYDRQGGTLKEQAEAAAKKESEKDLKTP